MSKLAVNNLIHESMSGLESGSFAWHQHSQRNFYSHTKTVSNIVSTGMSALDELLPKDAIISFRRIATHSTP